MISQLTVFLENDKGRLTSPSRVLSDPDVNLHALYLADTPDIGLARLIFGISNTTSWALLPHHFTTE